MRIRSLPHHHIIHIKHQSRWRHYPPEKPTGWEYGEVGALLSSRFLVLCMIQFFTTDNFTFQNGLEISCFLESQIFL